MTAGLLLISSGSLHFLADGLAECKFRFGKLYLYLITAQKLADNHFQLLVADAVEKALTVLRIVDSPQGQIFFHELGKRAGDLVFVALGLCRVTHICIWCGDLRLMVNDGSAP